MIRHRIHIILIIYTLALSSCATMFNSKKTSYCILASEPDKPIIDNDTLNNPVDFAKKDSSYYTYKQSGKPLMEYTNILKITPLKLVGILNPAIELSYERRTGPNFSTQLMASYLLPMTIMDIGSAFKPDIKGFRVAIEENYT